MNLRITALTAAISLATGAAMADTDPRALPDDTWISLNGTVTSVASNNESFRLDYGDGSVTVEMDDWDTFGEAFAINIGDNVTVYGDVDDDLFETTTIEAGSVYVEDLNTYFYASAADEEAYGEWSVTVAPVVGDLTWIGSVKEVSPLTETFTLEVGDKALTVDTSEMFYNPLDEEGFQKIEQGDRVRVDGIITEEFFGGLELEADTIVTLQS